MTISNVDKDLIRRREKQLEPPKIKRGGIVVGEVGKGYSETRPTKGHQVMVSDVESPKGVSWVDKIDTPFENGGPANISNLRKKYLEGTTANASATVFNHGCPGRILGISVAIDNGSGSLGDTGTFILPHYVINPIGAAFGYIVGYGEKYIRLDVVTAYRNKKFRCVLFYLPEGE